MWAMARAPSGTIRAAARLGAPAPGADSAGGMEAAAKTNRAADIASAAKRTDGTDRERGNRAIGCMGPLSLFPVI